MKGDLLITRDLKSHHFVGWKKQREVMKGKLDILKVKKGRKIWKAFMQRNIINFILKSLEFLIREIME